MLYGISPDKMTVADRLDEVASILARGFLRLDMFKTIPTVGEEVVDSSPCPSIHADGQ